ncbi:MAG: flippase-like domain-containing protein [Nitrospirae bacterium]|nr:flippase-like domain-containing protein [Nitrospirota bacterium]
MSKKHLHLFIGLVIIALSMYYAFRGVKLSELSDALMSVRYIYLVPAVILVVLSYLLRAMRWRYLVRPVKKDIKTSALFSPLMVGYMSNMLPARAGEFIRAYLLARKERISFGSAFATIFIERLFDLILLLFMIVWILLFIPDAFAPKGQDSSLQVADKVRIFGLISFILCLFILLFSALLQFRNDLALKITGFFIKPFPLKWKEKIIDLVHSFREGLNIIRDGRGFLATILLSFLIWGIFVVTYYPIYLAFDIDKGLPIVSSLLILCLMVAVFITLAPTPGFLGSYHLACVAALHGIYGVPKAVALSYGIVAWLVAMGSTVVIGSIFALKDHVSIFQVSAEKEKSE